MQQFNLTTVAGYRIVAYEPINANSEGEAIAFCQGLLTERTRNALSFLGKMGVHYEIDHGHRGVLDLSVTSENPIGGWHIAEVGTDEHLLLWRPGRRDQSA